MKPLTSNRAQNASIMYATATDPTKANKKPEKENSTHFWAPFAKKNYMTKNPSQRSGAPNSARGAIEFQQTTFDSYKTRITINQGKALTRNPSMKLSSRATSIDKKIGTEKMPIGVTKSSKQLLKTQSMVISQ